MPTILRSFLTLTLILTPSLALACMPADPYDYPIRGAYLVVSLSVVMGLSLELFRLLLSSEVVRRRLRLAAYTFALIGLVAILLGCALRALQTEWQQSLPLLPAGATKLRC